VLPINGCLPFGSHLRRSRNDVCVEEPDAPKLDWIGRLPEGRPAYISLARIVDADGGRDEVENRYYEAEADPSAVRMETSKRRFRGQYLRRLRRLSQAARHKS
jgi:hypothetical protein